MINLYDFDKTLTRNDSFFQFIKFYIKNDKKYWKIAIFLFFGLLFKIGVINNFYFKNFIIKNYFKNKKKIDIENLAYNFYLSNSVVLNSLYDKINDNSEDINIVSSASPEIYLKYFFSKKTIVIGTKLKFSKDNICMGIIKNNYGINKLISLKNKGFNEIDNLYTDSYSDRPLMKISKKTYIVSNGKINKVFNQ